MQRADDWVQGWAERITVCFAGGDVSLQDIDARADRRCSLAAKSADDGDRLTVDQLTTDTDTDAEKVG